MSFLDLVKTASRVFTPSKEPTIQQVVDQVYQQTGKQIADGLSNPTASTGKPIAELHGAAKKQAQLSNIGGGSKAIGGGGTDKGLEIVTRHAQAQTAKTMLEKASKKNLGKK